MLAFDFWSMLILAAVAGITIGVVVSIARSQRRAVLRKAIEKHPELSRGETFVGEDGKCAASIAEGAGKLGFFTCNASGDVSTCEYSFGDVLSSEVVQDGTAITRTKRTSQVGGALLGAVLAGPVGAIIGGLSGSRVAANKVRKVDVRVVVNDMEHPSHSICFLGDESAEGGVFHKEAIQQATRLHDLISVAIRRADREDRNAERSGAVAERSSIADEIRELHRLMVDGIITPDQFDAQKKRLLGQ